MTSNLGGRIALVGAGGRMGRSILDNLAGFEHLALGGAVVSAGSVDEGVRFGGDVVGTADLVSALASCDLVIDFSSPASCLAAAEIAASREIPFVSGTTGLNEEQTARLRVLSERTAVLLAANFSVGVTMLERLVELASRAAGGDFDVEIFEAHHRRKVDAPSGTALALGRAAARGREVALEDVARFERSGHTGARTDSEIGFSVVRGGDIVGEHTVFLCGAGERLELTHRATDRGIFARGALRAAGWMLGKEPGWYSMSDVLFG